MSDGFVKRLMTEPLVLLRETPMVTGDFLKAKLETKTRNTLDYYHVPREDRISWFDLSKNMGDYRTEPKLELAVELNRRSTSAQLKRGKVFKYGKALKPLFYLPYLDNELVRMKLESPDKTKVDFFTTAMIDGCSVYIEGPADAPTVTHANAQSVQTTSTDDSYAAKTIKIAAKTAHMTQQFQLIKKGAATVVERPHYMVEDPNQLRQVVQDFKLSKGLGADVDVTYSPFGAVVGFRNKQGNWTFYVQKNGVFQYIAKSQTSDRQTTYSGNRVLDVSELWPNGDGGFTLVP